MVYLAQDKDFKKVDGNWIYIGEAEEVEIPQKIGGETLTKTMFMFSPMKGATNVTKVVLKENNVTDMASMFNGCEATSLDLSSFDTSSVTNMASMFHGCKLFNKDISSWNVSNVTNMSCMFNGCKS